MLFPFVGLDTSIDFREMKCQIPVPNILVERRNTSEAAGVFSEGTVKDQFCAN